MPTDSIPIPAPIILTGPTPTGGMILPISSALGGLFGAVLLAQEGPEVLIEFKPNGGAFEPVSLPFAVGAGTLRLTRSSTDPETSAILATYPLTVPEAGAGANPLPAGGATGTILAKTGPADYAVAWVPAPTSGPGGSETPQRLSHEVTGGVMGSGPRPSSADYIDTVRVFKPANGFPVSFNALQAIPFSWETVTITVDGAVVYSSGDYGFADVDRSGALTLYVLAQTYTGDEIDIRFETGSSLLNLYDRATQSASPGFAQEVLAGGVDVPLTASVQVLLLGTVTGSLLPDAMNVVFSPSALKPGEFEIVSPPGSAPVLRFKRSDGQVFTLAMTPES